jgi:hypothetical protein
MEVHLKPDVQAELERMAHAREMLDRRFDDLESGRVKPIDGEEAYRRLMEKTEAQRQRHRPA